MKIHFILAPPIKKPKMGELSEGRIPPLGILYLIAYLREKIGSLQIKVTDGTVKGFEKTYQEVKDFNPDILCVSYYTLMALGAYKFINMIKKDNPDLFIITGGPHATALPEEPFRKAAVDIVVLGEGEVTLYELVNLFIHEKHQDVESLAKIDGIAYRDNNGQIKFTKTREHIEDLDTIPFPARDLIDLNNYKGWYINKEKREAAVFFARGCPYNCTFCSNVVWKKSKPYVRTRSPKNILDEIEMLYKSYGIREIYDCSDEFNIDLKHALAVCEELKHRNLDVVWKASMRAAPLSEELVKAMVKSGCWYVLIGIESGNEEALRGINKRVTLQQVEEACKLFKKYNLKVQGLFMLYNVWEENGQLKYENTEMVKKTFKYVSNLIDKRLLDYIGWSVTVPYPGSQLYNIAQKYNLIKDEYKENWDYWLSKDSYVIQLPGITPATQIRMKTLGSILRAKMLLHGRDFRFKDISWMFGKGLKIVVNEIKTWLKS